MDVNGAKNKNMNNLLIIGAGSFSTEVEEMACLVGYTNIFFLDDKATGSLVIGKTSNIGNMRDRFDTAIVALGNNGYRRKYHEVLKAYNYTIPILIHPTAYVSPDAMLSPGCIIRTYAVISRYAKLGEGVIVNIGGKIDHHCEIGDFSMNKTEEVIRGSAKVEAGSWIKANAVVE